MNAENKCEICNKKIPVDCMHCEKCEQLVMVSLTMHMRQFLNDKWADRLKLANEVGATKMLEKDTQRTIDQYLKKSAELEKFRENVLKLFYRDYHALARKRAEREP